METFAGARPARIADSSRTTLIAAWLMAAFWNAIAWTTALVAGRELRDWRLAVVAVFPLAGIALFVWAVRATLRYRRFGTSVLELPAGAGIVGHGLAGTVLVPIGVPAAAAFSVVFRRVVRSTSGAGRSRRTAESIGWEERTVVAGRTDGRSVRVPVAFRIPEDEAPTGAGEAKDSRVVWRLEVEADVNGVDYASRFEVPVLAAAAAGALATPDAALPALDAALPTPVDPASYRPDRRSPIQVSSTRRGTEILFPAARNPGAAASLTLFLALWCGAIAVMFALGAPLFFPIVFGIFAAPLLVGVLQMWFGVTRVAADRDGVTVTTGLLGGGSARTVPASEIAGINIAVGMQAGNAVYYDVRIMRRNGRRVTAGSGIRDKREAEWLAHTLRSEVLPAED